MELTKICENCLHGVTDLDVPDKEHCLKHNKYVQFTDTCEYVIVGED